MTPIASAAEAWRASAPPVRRFLAASFCLGCGIAFFEVLLNLDYQEAGLSKVEISDVLSQRAVGTVLATLPAGSSLARRRLPAVLGAASALTALAMVGLVLARGGLERQIAATAFGFGITFRFLAAPPFLYRHVPEHRRATMFGLDAVAITASQVLGCAVAGAAFGTLRACGAARLWAFHATLLGGAVLALASAVAYSGVRDAPPEAAPADPASARPARFAMPRIDLLARLCFPFLLVGAGAGLTIPYLNLYFEDRFGASATLIAVFYAAVAATTTLAYLLSPWLADRFGLVRSVVGSEILSIPFFLILAYSASFPISVVAFLMRGALMNLAYPLYGNFIMQIVEPEQRERTNALTKLVWNGSWVVTARVAGHLLEGRGGDYAPVMLTTAALYFAASASFYALFGRRRPR